MPRRFPVEVLTALEVRALVHAAGRGLTAYRNRALIVTLWRAGLRCAEALALAPRDINLRTGTVRVRNGKGGRARTVALDPLSCEVVRVWVGIRSRLTPTAPPPRSRLFCTLRGTPLQPAYLRQLLPRLARRAGIEKRVHPHALRHTFAVELSREGVPIHLIQSALGHSNVATTSDYLAHLEPRELVDAIRARVWPEDEHETAATPDDHPSDEAHVVHISDWCSQLAALPKNVLPPDGPKGQ